MTDNLISERKERLRLCYQYLKDQGRVTTYTDVSEYMEVSLVAVRIAFSPASEILSDSFVSKFVNAYDGIFSEKWILTGEGNMLTGRKLQGDPSLSHRWQRISHIADREGLGYREMSERIGMEHPSTLYRVMVKHTRPQDRTLDRILASFPQYERQWLYSGRGPMLKADMKRNHPSKGPSIVGNAEPYKAFGKMSFPVMNQEAAAGKLIGYGDPEYTPESHLEVPVDREYQGDYALFRVKGDSMDDGSIRSLADGDVVLARSIPFDYWHFKLHTHDWLYFIFMTYTEGVVIKSIADQDIENGILTLRSLNHIYPDITLHMKDVYAIYNVIEVTRRSLHT